MTRRSERELERAVDALDSDTVPDDEPDLTEEEAAAIRAIFQYLQENRIDSEPYQTPTGFAFPKPLLEEMLEWMDDDLERAYRRRYNVDPLDDGDRLCDDPADGDGRGRAASHSRR